MDAEKIENVFIAHCSLLHFKGSNTLFVFVAIKFYVQVQVARLAMQVRLDRMDDLECLEDKESVENVVLVDLVCTAHLPALLQGINVDMENNVFSMRLAQFGDA